MLKFISLLLPFTVLLVIAAPVNVAHASLNTAADSHGAEAPGHGHIIYAPVEPGIGENLCPIIPSDRCFFEYSKFVYTWKRTLSDVCCKEMATWGKKCIGLTIRMIVAEHTELKGKEVPIALRTEVALHRCSVTVPDAANSSSAFYSRRTGPQAAPAVKG